MINSRIAYQGEPGAFSEAAAFKIKPGCEPVPKPTFDEVFAAVAFGSVDFGVLPVENSSHGSIHRNYDLLLRNDIPIVGEVEVPVVHHLLALRGVTLSDIGRIYSHPQALGQCEHFLAGLDSVEQIASYDTAGSAKLIVREQLKDAAAIASARAGELYGLVTVASSIQDFSNNTTRFVVIGRDPLDELVPDKTTIVFRLNNEPAALLNVLQVLASVKMNITKLESRPVAGEPWQYSFYLEIVSTTEEVTNDVAIELSRRTTNLRVLGTYFSWEARSSLLSE